MPSTQPILPIGWEAQIHRDTYIAVLNGHLHKHGAKGEFARKVGITAQYLSYLLDSHNHRTPSPQTAKAMVKELNLSQHERAHLLEHLLMAREHEEKFHHVIEQALTQVDVKEAAQEVIAYFDLMQFSDTPQEVLVARRQTGKAAMIFLQRVNPWHYPVEYSEVALALHELNSQIDHHSRALYHAKRAHYVLSMAELDRNSDVFEAATAALTNAIRLEAVSYNNLGLAEQSYHLILKAETSLDARRHPSFWLPHLYRDKLSTLSSRARSSVEEAETIAVHGLRALEGSDDDNPELLAIMLKRSLMSSYLRKGQFDIAAMKLAQLYDEARALPRIGSLHQVMLMKDYAQALWQQKEQDGWAEIASGAIELAANTGLDHMLGVMGQQYANISPQHRRMLTRDAASYLAAMQPNNEQADIENR